VLLIGDEQIPKEVVEGLSDDCLQAFLREPDPRRWPEGMEGLIEFLSDEERTRAYSGPIFARLAPLIEISLRQWARAAWEEFAATPLAGARDQSLFVEEAARFLAHEVRAVINETRSIGD
jgi:hypothetical protein